VPRDAHRAAWEAWGTVDPLWAAVTEPDARHGGWDAEAFLATGRAVVDELLADAAALGRPAGRALALDVGCGAGRLTQALASRFDRAIGLDVSAAMVRQAQQLDGGRSGAEFRVNTDDSLAGVERASVDVLVCILVLQHLPTRAAIEGYLAEFVRVLAPGGVAIVQLPTHVPPSPRPTGLRQRLALRRRVTGLLRALHVSPKVLYEHLGWVPEMSMRAIPRDETVAVFERANGEVLRVSEPTTDHGGVVSCFYFVGPRDPASGG